MRISDWSSDVCSSDLDAATDVQDRSLCGRDHRGRTFDCPGVGCRRALRCAWRRNALDLQWLGLHVLWQFTQHRSGSPALGDAESRSEEPTSELQSLIRHSYAVFCMKQQNRDMTHCHITFT